MTWNGLTIKYVRHTWLWVQNQNTLVNTQFRPNKSTNYLERKTCQNVTSNSHYVLETDVIIQNTSREKHSCPCSSKSGRTSAASDRIVRGWATGVSVKTGRVKRVPDVPVGLTSSLSLQPRGLDGFVSKKMYPAITNTSWQTFHCLEKDPDYINKNKCVIFLHKVNLRTNILKL